MAISLLSPDRANYVSRATINVVPWVWGPEILPLEARAKGTAISVSAHWIWVSLSLLATSRHFKTRPLVAVCSSD